jgi:hypothetical protein
MSLLSKRGKLQASLVLRVAVRLRFGRGTVYLSTVCTPKVILKVSPLNEGLCSANKKLQYQWILHPSLKAFTSTPNQIQF